ncbi:hypothetical protein Tco_1468154 [Tanacetum coccineum]
MSDSEHSTVSYTSISSDSDPLAWGIPLIDAGEVPEMDPYEEVSQQGHVAPLSPAYVPSPMELEHHVPMYIPEPVEGPEEDPIDYVVDPDDDEDDEEESSEDDDDEEEEHLAPADSTAIASLATDPVPSAEETEPFETDESAATPPPPSVYHTTSRMYVRSQAPIPFPSEAEIPSPPLPVPSPPTTSPTYAEAPLGYKVVEIRRRADIPKADIPPRKRLLLTAPTPRFKVGESSVATTRQPGSTMACRVDYGFMDTAEVCRRESKEFYTRHQDAQRYRVAILDEVGTLRRYLSSLCTTHEQERVKARQALDRFEDTENATKEKCDSNHPTPMNDAQIKALIARGVAYALAERDADKSRNGDDNHDSGSDGRRRMPVARECTYSNFLKYQPLNFKGTEGVVGLTQWFERMESVFHISNCAVKNQVKYATCTLLGNALTWWNSHVKTVGHDAVKGTDVESYTQCFQELDLLCERMFLEEYDKVKKYVGGLPDMIQGSVMASQPKKMQDAIEFATELMDQKIRTLAERQDENKRKFEDTSRNNQN